MKNLRLLVLFLLTCTLSGYAQTGVQDDSLYQILYKEIVLTGGSVANRTFPIKDHAFHVEDLSNDHVRVSNGSLYDNMHYRHRNAYVSISVYRQETEHIGMAEYYTDLPLENDMTTLHRILQEGSQQAYTKAVRDCRNNSVLKQKPHYHYPSSDLHVDEPEYEPPIQNSSFEKEQLINKLRRCTGVLSEVSHVMDCSADVTYRVDRIHHISHQTYWVKNFVRTDLQLRITMLSDDGRILYKSQTFQFDNPDDIFEEELLRQKIWDLYAMEDSCITSCTMNAKDSLLYHDWWKESMSANNDESFSLNDVMREMMLASKDSLHLGDAEAPYNLRHLVTDAHIASAKATMGLSVLEMEFNERYLETMVDVGSDVRNQENMHIVSSIDMMLTPTSFQVENRHSLPLDNHRKNFHDRLWRAEAMEYPESLLLFQLKEEKSLSLSETSSKPIPDRSESLTKSVFNPWPIQEECLPQLQNFACEFSQIIGESRTKSAVNIRYYQANAYYTDLQGLQYIQPFTLVEVSILENWTEILNLYFKDIRELEKNHDTLVAIMKEVQQFLDERDKAPEMNEVYDGPVLFVGAAAAQLFAKTFLTGEESLIAQRNPMYDFSDKLPSPETHMSRLLDHRIVHPGISITATDRISEYQGVSLIGSYEVDAEGVEVEKKVELVNHGELVTLLSNRTPTDKIGYSNGHQRLAMHMDHLETCCGPGVVEMSCKSTMSRAKLLKRLRDMARAAGYDHAYIVTEMAIGFDSQTVYRINVHNGKKQLVKNAKLRSISYRDFQRMTSGDQVKKAYNLMVPGTEKEYLLVPCSVILPDALLFEHLEVSPDQNH